MFSDSAQPHQSSSDMPESTLRLGMMFAELWHDWLETISQVAYQTHRTCEFFIENGGSPDGQYGPFDSRPWRNASQGSHGSIDMGKLQQCLQSMDPMQAARVMHAVQTMQVMESMLKRRRSRATEPEEAAW